MLPRILFAACRCRPQYRVCLANNDVLVDSSSRPLKHFKNMFFCSQDLTSHLLHASLVPTGKAISTCLRSLFHQSAVQVSCHIDETLKAHGQEDQPHREGFNESAEERVPPSMQCKRTRNIHESPKHWHTPWEKKAEKKKWDGFRSTICQLSYLYYV